jgi:hypothetical protein
MYSIYFNEEMERSDSILRNSLFDIRNYAVRRLIQAIEVVSLIIKKPCHFDVVSYEREAIEKRRITDVNG